MGCFKEVLDLSKNKIKTIQLTKKSEKISPLSSERSS
jgi:hypothetical protein